MDNSNRVCSVGITILHLCSATGESVQEIHRIKDLIFPMIGYIVSICIVLLPPWHACCCSCVQWPAPEFLQLNPIHPLIYCIGKGTNRMNAKEGSCKGISIWICLLHPPRGVWALGWNVQLDCIYRNVTHIILGGFVHLFALLGALSLSRPLCNHSSAKQCTVNTCVLCRVAVKCMGFCMDGAERGMMLLVGGTMVALMRERADTRMWWHHFWCVTG